MGGAVLRLPLYVSMARKRKNLIFFNHHSHPAAEDHMLVATCFVIKVLTVDLYFVGLAHFISWDLIYISVLSARAPCLTGLGFELSVGHRI